ncbi:MAG: endonuclease, partial [Psychrobacter alimentarius]
SLSTEAQTDDAVETIDLSKLLMGLNTRITQVLGSEAQLGHAFLWSVSTLEQLQIALCEQVIPQLAQAAGGQVVVLQYIFKDEPQPLSAQFIQDHQALIDHGASHHMDSQNNNAAQHPMFSGHNAFLTQSMTTGNYRINTDLITKTGEFAKPFVYQRLYD